MGRTRIVEAMIPVEPSADGSVPTEFRLLASGINTYNDGDKILFDDEAAAETLKRYRARGIDLMADYEHMSLAKPPVQAPASAKKWVPEVRGGDLLATQVAWTNKAKSMLAEGEYRYFSIACRVDVKTNRCVELINFALTNLPAADGITALIAASRNFNDDDKEESMKSVIVALGLNADAGENEAVAVASRYKDFADDVCSALKVKSLPEAMGAVRGAVASAEQVVALSAKVAQLETTQRSADFDALVKSGQDANQITPAMASSEWLKSLRGREDGCAQLKSFLATAPKVAAKGADIVEVNDRAPVVEITTAEIEAAKRFVGDDPVALQKRLDALRAMKAADAKVRS